MKTSRLQILLALVCAIALGCLSGCCVKNEDCDDTQSIQRRSCNDKECSTGSSYN